MIPKVLKWGFRGGICIEKWSLNFDSGTPSAIFGIPQNAQNGSFFGFLNRTTDAPTKMFLEVSNGHFSGGMGWDGFFSARTICINGFWMVLLPFVHHH